MKKYEYLPCSADFTHMDATMLGGVTRIAFKYKRTDFRINVLKNDFSVHNFVFVFS